MTAVALTKTLLSSVKADAVIVGIACSDGGPVLAPGAVDVDKAFRKRLLAHLISLGATGRKGEVIKLATLGAIPAPTLVAVGLGPAPDRRGRYDEETVRRAVGLGVRTLAGTGHVATSLAAVNGVPTPADVRAVAEGAMLGGYAYTRYRSNGSTSPAKQPPVDQVSLVVPNPRERAVKATLDRAATVAEAIALCRDLVNTPAADLHPADLAAAAEAACKPAGCDVEILDEKALKKGAFGGLLGVGQGAANPPRLVRIAWTGGRKASHTVHLVGKGITFDSGGLSLKTAPGMEWMKADMGGAAAVIGTLQSVARLKLPVNVVGWVATAENMPSGSAIRPSDVLTMRGGTTVEVMNTDAEGRLVMADAIVRASEESPDVIVDVATLTGSALVALGSRVYAVMGNDDDLRDEIVAAAGRAGEQSWAMPLPPELRKSLDSDVADLRNVGPDKFGGMMIAGLFLQEFVPDGVRWAHLDVAGPAWNDGEPHDYTPHGGTGVPIRSLVQWLEELAG